MNLDCDIALGLPYTSLSQRARVISEGWMEANGFCLACNSEVLVRTVPNTHCTDFSCPACAHRYELKTFRRRPTRSLIDGAYGTMISRVLHGTAPTLFMLERTEKWRVTGLSALHSVFLTPSVIERRNPLPVTARRAGWVGCKIRLDKIASDAELHIIRSGRVSSRKRLREQFGRFQPLASLPVAERGWVSLVLKAIRNLGKEEFELQEIYAQRALLAGAYPGNNHIEAKIRQQLQVLRNLGVVRFMQRGHYCVVA
jgi:type II restriction enzyme